MQEVYLPTLSGYELCLVPLFRRTSLPELLHKEGPCDSQEIIDLFTMRQ